MNLREALKTDSFDDYLRRALGEQESKADQQAKEAIGALRDTDFKDQDAFFRMAQLLKGLASSADESEMAKKFLSQLSDDVTGTANKVLGKKEGLGEADRNLAEDKQTEKFKPGDAVLTVKPAKEGGIGLGIGVVIERLPSGYVVFWTGIDDFGGRWDDNSLRPSNKKVSPNELKILKAKLDRVQRHGEFRS